MAREGTGIGRGATEGVSAGGVPAVVVSGSQGVQVNIGGPGLQANVFATGVDAGRSAVTPDEFRSDVVALLRAVDDWACRAALPPHLAPGADVLQMARTVRLLGRVRRPQGQHAPKDTDPTRGRERVYTLPAERDDRSGEPPQPWEQTVSDHDWLVVLADPGMGKSWLLRLEAHRLASAALAQLKESAAIADVAVPVPVRADVLAAAPGRSLAEAAAGYLTAQGLLSARSEGLMRELIASGGAVLLIDALDEVPREAARGGQAPRKRLEDQLRRWAERCPGRTRCVVTTRLAGYSGPPVLGAREAELLPFTPTDIDAAVRAWELSAQADGWLRGRLSDPAAAGMARVPLLLALICSLAADPHGRQEDLPQTRAGLYAAVVWQFLSGAHRAVEHGAPAPALDQGGRQALLRILTQIAVTFADTSRGWVDRMPHTELLDAIRSAGDALADVGGSPAAVLDRLAGQAGILVPVGNPAGGEQDYVFLHRTIAEYLVARHLCDLPAESRMAIIVEHQWFDPDWAEVIPMLGGMLSSRQDGAPTLIGHFLDQRPDPLHYAFRTALRILSDAPNRDRLLTSRQESELSRRIRGLLTRDHTSDMLTGVLATASAWPRPVTTALLALLGDHNQHVRHAAILALAERDTPEITAALLTRLTDHNLKVRYAASWALAERDTPEATAALLTRLTDHNPNVRQTTVRALAGRDAPEVTTALLTRLTDDDPDVRRMTVAVLAKRDTPEVTTALLTRLTDHDPSVRYAALDVLAERDTPSVTAAVLTRLNDRDSVVRAAAFHALGRRDTPEVTAALLSHLTNRKASVRRAAVLEVVERDTPETTAALLTCLNDYNWFVRDAAANALAGRDEAVILLRLTRLGSWRAWPGRRQERFDLANRIADRVYLRTLPADRALIRRRLGNITRWV
jgi:HEAT repeat protein